MKVHPLDLKGAESWLLIARLLNRIGVIFILEPAPGVLAWPTLSTHGSISVYS